MITRVVCRMDNAAGMLSAHAVDSNGNAFARVMGFTKEEVLARFRTALGQYLSSDAWRWVEASKHGGNRLNPNCPEGTLALPADDWHCKIHSRPCPLQAQVLLGDRDRFFSSCLASGEKAESIFAAVSGGAYDGFHHVPGRYLCVECERTQGRETFKYHYPWEMTHIEDVVEIRNLSRTEFRDYLEERGENALAANNALCGRHLVELAQRLDEGQASKLTVIEADFYPR